MKKITIILVFTILAIGFVFAGHTHSYEWTVDGSKQNQTVYTYDGTVANFYANLSGLSYTSESGAQNATMNTGFYYYIYGLGSNTTYYNKYANDADYRLVYIGGNFYAAKTYNSWTESSSLWKYIYPEYINYLRPDV